MFLPVTLPSSFPGVGPHSLSALIAKKPLICAELSVCPMPRWWPVNEIREVSTLGIELRIGFYLWIWNGSQALKESSCMSCCQTHESHFKRVHLLLQETLFTSFLEVIKLAPDSSPAPPLDPPPPGGAPSIFPVLLSIDVELKIYFYRWFQPSD